MAIVAGERPGVYTDYTVSGLIGGDRRGRAVGLVCKSSYGTALEIIPLTRESQGIQFFGEDSGESRMLRMLRILFAGGVPVVYAVTVTGAGMDEAQAYAAAFDLLSAQEGIAAVVCDSSQTAVHKALKDSVLRASENRLERIGCCGGAGSLQENIQAAASLNCERIVYTCQLAQVGEDKSACYLAGVIAAAVATAYDPSVPLTGTIAQGIDAAPLEYEENEINLLLRGGVTLFETTGGVTEVIRAVTTRTTTEGASDGTYRELNTILIIDDVLTSVREALKTRLKGAKNNAQNRASIATQTQLELENKLGAGIIDSYEKPLVRADENDPGICVVELDFAVVRGLNQIHVSAHVKI